MTEERKSTPASSEQQLEFAYFTTRDPEKPLRNGTKKPVSFFQRHPTEKEIITFFYCPKGRIVVEVLNSKKNAFGKGPLECRPVRALPDKDTGLIFEEDIEFVNDHQRHWFSLERGNISHKEQEKPEIEINPNQTQLKQEKETLNKPVQNENVTTSTDEATESFTQVVRTPVKILFEKTDEKEKGEWGQVETHGEIDIKVEGTWEDIWEKDKDSHYIEGYVTRITNHQDFDLFKKRVVVSKGEASRKPKGWKKYPKSSESLDKIPF